MRNRFGFCRLLRWRSDPPPRLDQHLPPSGRCLPSVPGSKETGAPRRTPGDFLAMHPRLWTFRLKFLDFSRTPKVRESRIRRTSKTMRFRWDALPSFWGFFFKVRTLKKNIFRTKDFFFVGGKKILFFFHHEKNFLTRKYFFFMKKHEKKGQKKTPKKGGPYP
jgi:hypothetical protein